MFPLVPRHKTKNTHIFLRDVSIKQEKDLSVGKEAPRRKVGAKKRGVVVPFPPFFFSSKHERDDCYEHDCTGDVA